MARLAAYLRMLAGEREPGRCMVEIAVSLNSLK